MKKLWSQDELDFLKKNYPEHGAEYCSYKLERTVKAVRKQVHILKLKRKRQIPEKYQLESFSAAVSKSKSFNDVCRNIGMTESHGNWTTVKNYVKEYDLDISHFYQNLPVKKRTMLSLEEILVKDSSYRNNKVLKKKLIDAGLKEEKCEMKNCPVEKKWLGQDIVLQLDHKNGDNTDNRLENLRLLCPNCHSQTPTYAGKGRKSEKISYKKRKTSPRKPRKSKKPSREVLAGEFESNPNFSALGRKYGVSDNAVRKWCKSYDLI